LGSVSANSLYFSIILLFHFLTESVIVNTLALSRAAVVTVIVGSASGQYGMGDSPVMQGGRVSSGSVTVTAIPALAGRASNQHGTGDSHVMLGAVCPQVRHSLPPSGLVQPPTVPLGSNSGMFGQLALVFNLEDQEAMQLSDEDLLK
jgi:hypothetical protein